jgi:hypothetical protein
MIVATVGIAKAQTDASNSDKATNDLRHEVGILGGGGMSVLNYSLNMGGSKTDGADGISGFAGIAYTWNITHRIGIATGLELIRYGAKTTYETITSDPNDPGNTYNAGDHVFRMLFNYTMENYVEEQTAAFLTIPVMLQYSVPLSGTKKFYVSGGLKFGLPINAKATIFPGTVTTSGYYSFQNQPYTDLPQYGFISAEALASTTNDIDVSVLLTASLETGVRFCLTDKILLYTGAYLDYGLNNLRSTKDKELLNYQVLIPSELKHASVLNTSHVNNVKTLGVGLKVKVSFGW